MAEATLMVTFSRREAGYVEFHADADALQHGHVAPATGGAEARALIGCGRSEGVRRLAIVDPQTLSVAPAGQVGEIWAAGPNISGGYWNRPEQTVSTFGAFLQDGEGPFLRTGDLGFQHDGHLFVTGRLKDLIIIRGLNHYPQDIEATVERSHPALRPAAGAAFSVEVGDEERLVVVQEVDRQHLRSLAVDEVVDAIRRAVAEEHEVEPWAVTLIRPLTVLKTSSGKIQRQGCRTAFLAGGLATVGEWRKVDVAEAAAEARQTGPRSESEVTGWLLARLARESGLDADEIDLAQPFASFGLDSARSLTLIGDLENWLGRRLSPVVLWNYPTVESLARHLGE
jgi:acyl-CoA synthetase (AMP-forming)/AMP-acid ligase II/acyl carrier protein